MQTEKKYIRIPIRCMPYGDSFFSKPAYLRQSFGFTDLFTVNLFTVNLFTCHLSLLCLDHFLYHIAADGTVLLGG